jgi:putative ABC transport system substrate-binding protein
LYLPPDTFTITNRDLSIDLAARYDLPTVHGRRVFVDAGGLMSYDRGNLSEDYRAAASYVDRILRGEKAGDVLCSPQDRDDPRGLAVPLGIAATADELIE